MCIRVEWDNDDNSILRYQFGPGWTWKMLDEAMARASTMIEDHRSVDLILDFSGTKTMPDGAMLHFRRALTAVPRTAGYVVVAGANPALETAFTVLTQVDKPLSNRLLTVGTVDAARAVLAHPYSLSNRISPARVNPSDL